MAKEQRFAAQGLTEIVHRSLQLGRKARHDLAPFVTLFRACTCVPALTLVSAIPRTRISNCGKCTATIDLARTAVQGGLELRPSEGYAVVQGGLELTFSLGCAL